jgi:hypothetical protein
MAWKTALERRHAWNFAAQIKHTVEEDLRLVAADDAPVGRSSAHFQLPKRESNVADGGGTQGA